VINLYTPICNSISSKNRSAMQCIVEMHFSRYRMGQRKWFY
jgi:hypothetical protein